MGNSIQSFGELGLTSFSHTQTKDVTEINNRILKIHRFRGHGIWSQANNDSREHRPDSCLSRVEASCQTCLNCGVTNKVLWGLTKWKAFFKWILASIFFYEYSEKSWIQIWSLKQAQQNHWKRCIYKWFDFLKDSL